MANSYTTSERKSELEQDIFDFSKQQFEKNRRLSMEASWLLENISPLSETLRDLSIRSRDSRDVCITATVSTPDCDKSELFIEREEQLVLQKNSENEMSEEQLDSITKDIDQLEQNINEVRSEIKRLRFKSVSILTEQQSGFSKDKDADFDDTRSFLKLEKMISLLESEKNELESKRQATVLRLQNKMLDNIKAIQ